MAAMEDLSAAYCSPLWGNVAAMKTNLSLEEMTVLVDQVGYMELDKLFNLAESAPVIGQMVENFAMAEKDKHNPRLADDTNQVSNARTIVEAWDVSDPVTLAHSAELLADVAWAIYHGQKRVRAGLC